jgi:hypothetical protein
MDAIGMLIRGPQGEQAQAGLKRLGLEQPKDLRQKLMARLVGAILS